MTNSWFDTAQWSTEQWLSFSLLVFIAVAVLVLAYHMYTIIASLKKKREPPNFRLRRRFRR